MDNIEIVVQMYGAFRKYGGEITLTVPAGCTVGGVKSKLTDLLEPQDREILKSSAMANENQVLAEDDMLSEDCRIAVLPPVCGG